MAKGREVAGVIMATLPSGLYRVTCADGSVVTASLSGVPKQVTVRVIPGDKVLLEISPLDPSRGRIKVRISK
jgi:translation initiation factor IF-1